MPQDQPHSLYFATAFAAAVMFAATTVNASDSWFPDFIFPETTSTSNTKTAERTITGSIPRAAEDAKQSDRDTPIQQNLRRERVSSVKKGTP